jgi:hypothetical protein
MRGLTRVSLVLAALASAGVASGAPPKVSDGVVKIGVKGGPAGRGKVLVQASNDAKASRTALPTGIAASLEGSTTATLQLHASGAECFSAELTSVKKADGTRFKAIAP